jgi:hypothetical protein
MEREIQNGIEDYLHGLNAKARPAAGNVRSLIDPSAAAAGEFAQRLSQTDAETRREVAEFRQTASLLHQLQSPMEMPDQAPGFYARVMERIEAERASNSFWSIFLNPQFSRKLLLASAALLALLTLTFFTTENNAGWFGTAAPELVESRQMPVQEDFATANPSEPIEAGLVSHSESGHDQMLVELASYQQ